jgi:hypothetical protein
LTIARMSQFSTLPVSVVGWIEIARVGRIQGMRAMARLKSDRRALRQVARIALAVFDR